LQLYKGLFPDPDTQPDEARFWWDCREHLGYTIIDPLEPFELGGTEVFPFGFKRGFRELFCAQEMIKLMLYACGGERRLFLMYCKMCKDLCSPFQVWWYDEHLAALYMLHLAALPYDTF
jgi:hypothetical protein